VPKLRKPRDTEAVAALLECTQKYREARCAFSKRRIHDCLELLRAAERSGHDAGECAACRWDCWMLLGRFEEAWKESDSILARGLPDPNRLWDGLPFAGKRVMIRCLHGFGDAIQFVRYAKLVRQDAASVAVQTHPQLVSLFKNAPFIDRVTTWDDGPGLRHRDWDQQIEVMELPRAFRTTLDDIPAESPYLFVDRRHLARSPLAERPRRHPRVGVLWEGGEWNPARNVPFAEVLPVLTAPGFEVYSFQRGPGGEQLRVSGLADRIADLSGEGQDSVYFAADLMHIDLLITVDTMAAHLAGALGRPVWVLLPFEADWRWMLDRADSPWYPTMRLFRQKRPGEWRAVVEQVVRELESFRGNV
jgi:hypothetical protein